MLLWLTFAYHYFCGFIFIFPVFFARTRFCFVLLWLSRQNFCVSDLTLLPIHQFVWPYFVFFSHLPLFCITFLYFPFLSPYLCFCLTLFSQHSLYCSSLSYFFLQVLSSVLHWYSFLPVLSFVLPNLTLSTVTTDCFLYAILPVSCLHSLPFCLTLLQFPHYVFALSHFTVSCQFSLFCVTLLPSSEHINPFA